MTRVANDLNLILEAMGVDQTHLTAVRKHLYWAKRARASAHTDDYDNQLDAIRLILTDRQFQRQP